MCDNSTVSKMIYFELVAIEGLWMIGFDKEIMMTNVIIMARTRQKLPVAIIIMTVMTA